MKTQQFGMTLALTLGLALVPCNQQDGPAAQPVTPQASNPPRTFRVSQGVMERNLVRKIHPVYPEGAKAQRIQGDVLLRVHIDREGNVSDLKVEGKPSLLDDAAIDAVKQWKYKPMTLNGEPVPVETIIKIRFQL